MTSYDVVSRSILEKTFARNARGTLLANGVLFQLLIVSTCKILRGLNGKILLPIGCHSVVTIERRF